MQRRTPEPVPEPASGMPGGAAPPGEWLTVDGVAYRCVVLCLLVRTGTGRTGGDRREVLLGLKRTGFGSGRVVALGGKIDGQETALDAAVREVREESGIDLLPAGVREAGRITWSFPARPAWNMVAFLFTADAGAAAPRPSEEIEPRWYPIDELPWHSMWQDAPHWVPLVLDGRRIAATIVMDADNEGVASAVVR
ncbi:8-oxo-dGTP diphosphatase [Arthrobacter agilis]|uniref:8-oxo-dGTP diphosphatase n=1 Tax=Arthrobacter agilis TaxID=37921 RepID=UPI002783AF35|nr:NUDIX domain-containing protein [Arthrobacter agilis]MDQ0734306.1 8-oxo-dGTP diphosphatase [Arthrobacter agilis]